MSKQGWCKLRKTLMLVGIIFSIGVCSTRAEDKIVSVYSSGRSLPAVFQDLAGQANVECVLDSNISSTVDLSLKEMSFIPALSAICSAGGLEWEKSTPTGAGKEVYLIHRKGMANSAEPIADAVVGADEATTKTKVAFGPPAALAEPSEPTAKAKPKAEPADPLEGRQLHLNPAQMRLVLNGVPNKKINAVLEMWRQQNTGPRLYSLNGQIYPNVGLQSQFGNYGVPSGVKHHNSLKRGYYVTPSLRILNRHHR